MRTEMSDRALAQYLDLSREEFECLKATLSEATLGRYRDLDLVSKDLGMLAARYNRPPKADEDSDLALEAASRAAFGRLEAAIAANEEFRRVRSQGSGRPRRLTDEEAHEAMYGPARHLIFAPAGADRPARK